ncbi:MAG TPA: Glu/Leu/Phe/Val dehydrogenase dimerization domain-containing protein [Miltoncostaeaceae bacterium]|nr:Glu/Leu/Phe/Val dehydrogenase dimerization domain-containing protein [Miltoncostaeaceae bacterium]
MNVIDDAAVGPYERVVHAEDRRSGLRAIVAVHSTALGPAVGGTRFHPYHCEASATIDALRLAEGMTLKAAAAGLRLGGGKAVIMGDPERLRSPALWRAYAEVVDLFGGGYHTAEDVGTTPADMAALRAHTPFVLGIPGRGGWDGDPSPFTARGVLAAMRAAWEDETGAPSLAGTRVVVEGAGKVGGALAGLLAAEGATVMVSDIRTERAVALAARTGGRALDPAIALAQPCDILAPCAMGGGLSHATVGRLRCRWVVGSANNQLSDEGVAGALHDRGIGYVPDFVANAGGLICVSQELEGADPGAAGAAVDRVGDVVRDLLAAAHADGGTPLEAAHRRAASRLAPAGVR